MWRDRDNVLFCPQYYASEAGRSGRREGLGSAEATEMVLNNLFYITAKVRMLNYLQIILPKQQ